MITGVHAMFYSARATELRAFFRDKLGFPATDVGGGWLIFDLPSGDLGVHPARSAEDPHAAEANTHAISFFCEDIERTVAELKAKGVEFAHPVENHGYGLVTHILAPGDLKIQLYQPLYKKGG
jgi:catechol 2,3-dioxygenase-like lactoylglutathione lyase family enzyme